MTAMRRPLLPLLSVVALLAAVVVLATRGGGEDGHRFSVVVAEATNVIAGQAVRQSGREVGRIVSVDPVQRGRRARLVVEVDDDAWPLPGGTRLQLRWAGTANFGNRYLKILRGSGPGVAVADGAQLPSRAFLAPVEYDQLLATFDTRTRAGLSRMLRTAAPALAQSRSGLRRTLRDGPAALEEAAAVVTDVNADQRAVRTLVRATDRVLGAVDRSQPGIRRLLDGAAGTFDAVADESTRLGRALALTPETLRRTRATLRSADTTLTRADAVVGAIRPGVPAVRATAAPLGRVLGTVRRIGPDATATLATARRAAPDLDPLLARVGALSPELRSIGTQAVDALECIRPYTPEINSFWSNWGDFFAGTDGKDKLIRAQVQQFLPALSNVSGYNAAQAKQLFSGLEYGFPRPPGQVAGQPWFLPQCGAGPDALDPQKDPEIRTSAKVFDVPRLAPLVPLPRGGGR